MVVTNVVIVIPFNICLLIRFNFWIHILRIRIQDLPCKFSIMTLYTKYIQNTYNILSKNGCFAKYLKEFLP